MNIILTQLTIFDIYIDVIINNTYFKPYLDVSSWVLNFESEFLAIFIGVKGFDCK